LSSGRILVVDDNVDAADTLALLLEMSCYDTRIAYDGKQAVELARSFQPHLAILDINMPVMDGYEAARLLRRLSGPKLILVALTGRGQPADKVLASEAGFDIHLVKPTDGGELCRLVDRALEER
jgi:CheY-like chemotaxis protein